MSCPASICWTTSENIKSLLMDLHIQLGFFAILSAGAGELYNIMMNIKECSGSSAGSEGFLI